MAHRYRGRQVLVPTWGQTRYLFDDEFRDPHGAGTIDGTDPTPGPGGPRKLIDTGNYVTISGGVLDFSGGGGLADPAYWLDLVTNVAGAGVILEITPADTLGTRDVGLDNNRTDSIIHGLRIRDPGKIFLLEGAAQTVWVGTYTAVSHRIAIISRGSTLGFYALIIGGNYANWTLLWASSSSRILVDITPAIQARQAATFSFVRMFARAWLPTPSLYDSFTRSNGVIGSSETTGPDGGDGPTIPAIPWTGGATWTVASNKMINTPTPGAEKHVSANAASDPNGNEADAITGWSSTDVTLTSVSIDPQVGSYHFRIVSISGDGLFDYIAYSFTAIVGTWYRFTAKAKSIVGTSQAFRSFVGFTITPHFFIANWADHTLTALCTATNATVRVYVAISGNPADELFFDNFSITPLILSELINVPDLSVADVLIELQIAVDPAGTQTGIAFGWDSQSSPANGGIAYHDGENVHVDKCVAGTWTTVSSTATAFSADALIKVARRGSAVDVFYNNAKIDVTHTISDAAIVAGTRHGAFSTNATPPMDEVLIVPSGTEDQHKMLRKWSGGAP